MQSQQKSSPHRDTYIVHITQYYPEIGNGIEQEIVKHFEYFEDAKLFLYASSSSWSSSTITPSSDAKNNEKKKENSSQVVTKQDSPSIFIEIVEYKPKIQTQDVNIATENSSYFNFSNILNWFPWINSSHSTQSENENSNNKYISRKLTLSKYDTKIVKPINKDTTIADNMAFVYTLEEIMYLLSLPGANELVLSFINNQRMLEKLSKSIRYILKRESSKISYQTDNNFDNFESINDEYYSHSNSSYYSSSASILLETKIQAQAQDQDQAEDPDLQQERERERTNNFPQNSIISILKGRCEEILKPENLSKFNKILGYIILGQIAEAANDDFKEQWDNFYFAGREDNLFARKKVIALLYASQEFEKALKWCERAITCLSSTSPETLTEMSAYIDHETEIREMEKIKDSIQKRIQTKVNNYNTSISKWSKFKMN